MKKIVFLMLAAGVVMMVGCKKTEEGDNGGNGGNGGNGNTSTLVPGVYVDLGLASGVKWKDENEVGGLYRYDAVRKYGGQVPTKDMFEELLEECEWSWIEEDGFNGYKVTGPNGNYIKLSAEGAELLSEGVGGVGTMGRYWTSSPLGSHLSWYLNFYSSGKSLRDSDGGWRFIGRSLRLVQIGDQTVYDVPSGKHNVELVYGDDSDTQWQNISIDTLQKYNNDPTVDTIFMIPEMYNQFSTNSINGLKYIVPRLRERHNVNPDKVFGKGELQLQQSSVQNNLEIVRFFRDTLRYNVTMRYAK